jgi:putative membrane protein
MDILSSREWAIVTWIIIYLCFTIFVLKVDFTDVLKSFFNKKLNILWISILLYNLFLTIILSFSRYWNNIYIKDIVFWVVFSCITSTISIFDKNKIFSFKKLIVTNITVSALIEFILSELTLSYYLELFLIGIILPTNFLFLVSQTKLEYKVTENVLKKFLSLLNFIFFVYILRELYKSFNFLLSQETWFKFLIPFIYSILCCPLYYAFIILNDYEKVSYKIQDHSVLENEIDRKYINKLKRRKLLTACGLVHKKYIYFDNEFSKKMRLANTKEEVNEIVREFEVSYKLNKKNIPKFNKNYL